MFISLMNFNKIVTCSLGRTSSKVDLYKIWIVKRRNIACKHMNIGVSGRDEFTHTMWTTASTLDLRNLGALSLNLKGKYLRPWAEERKSIKKVFNFVTYLKWMFSHKWNPTKQYIIFLAMHRSGTNCLESHYRWKVFDDFNLT